jgi:ketosteroid isomerase-like protein
MPSRERVQELIAYACEGRFLEALEEFYAEDAALQENAGPPRVGMPALVEFERAVVASIAEAHETQAASFVVDGDRCAINWVFDYTDTAGRRVRMDEIAYQTWRGDKIIRERFFYDTASLAAPA